MSKHTPTPWEILGTNENIIGARATPHSFGIIANVNHCHPDFKKQMEANAERIVHCVNNFDELLSALKTMLVAVDSDAKLPKDHPGHEAYLNIVAKPRAQEAITKAESN